MVDLTLRLISFPPETSLKMIAKEFLKEKRHKLVKHRKNGGRTTANKIVNKFIF